jgi:hypothetical protein
MDSINDWIEKYQPKKIDEIIGNAEEIDIIKSWLVNYDSQRKEFYREQEEKTKKQVREKKPKAKKVPEPVVEEDKTDINENIDDDAVDAVEDYTEIPIVPKERSTKKKYNSCLLIYGSHGIGKTTIVKAILNDMKYETEIINMYNLSSNKNIDEKINKITCGMNIFNSFDGNKNSKKKALVIDKLETISTQIEKKFIEGILRANDEKWFSPIIFISSLKHSKLITAIKNCSLTIRLPPPTTQDMDTLFMRIAKGEKFRFSSKATIMKIREYAQLDYLRLIHILFDLRATFHEKVSEKKEKMLTESQVDEYCKIAKTKDTDIEIYSSVAKLILRYPGINECLRLYGGEKVILPLMMHQNYPKCLTEYPNNTESNLDLAQEIADSIATGDLIENYIYSEQNWDMQDVHCFYTCINPSFNLTKIGINATPEYLKYKLEFPNDLNRTSIKKINKRNITNANVFLKNMDINDFMCAGELTRKLIDDKKVEECAKIYKSYAAKAETIISVLKIDKIDTSATQYQTNTKRLFNKFL